MIESGAVPFLIQLLSSPTADVREQAVWALGNIAGDSPRCRDYVLQAGALGPLLQILQMQEPSSPLSIQRNAIWTLSNFCRGKNPQPDWPSVSLYKCIYGKISPCLPILSKLINSYDDEVLTDTCWAISYLSDGENDKIEAVIQTAGMCQRLVELLKYFFYDLSFLATLLSLSKHLLFALWVIL